MAIFTLQGLKIAGIAASVPKQVEDNLNAAVLPENERELFVKTTGIRYRRVAPDGLTSSDLCLAAAEKLLSELNWNRSEIAALVFITQTPDYLLPNSSSIIQHKLGLTKNCIAFDVNLGCSGYVYGLSVVGSLLQNMRGAKALLLVGDISTATISMKDKSTAPLFSDAGSATALVHDGSGEAVLPLGGACLPDRQVRGAGGTLSFNLQTDGAGYEDIIITDGGFRNKFTAASLETVEYEKGVERNRLQMKLDGIRIFNFALREVAPNLEALLKAINVSKKDIDYFVFHQANQLMLEGVRRKLAIEAEKVPYSLYDYGNTGSATIPLTMVTNLREKLTSAKLRLALSGFGVGLSWGSAYIETEKIICPELLVI